MKQIPFSSPESYDISYDRDGRQSPAIESDAGQPNRINVIDRSHIERIPVAIGGRAVRRVAGIGNDR